MPRVDNPIRLWDGAPPGSESWTHEEVWTPSLPGGHQLVRNVTVPTLNPFLPDDPTDRAIIVCPGGAFHFLAIEHEGHAVAEFARRAGIASFVLKYRVVPTPVDPESYEQALVDAFAAGIHNVASAVLPLAVADAQRSLEVVRGQGYRHITMIGFSAGARIASSIVLQSHAERRPDAAALCYRPWVADFHTSHQSPPLFVMAASDDPLGVEGSFTFAETWRGAGAPVEFHLFERGGHGFGAMRTGLPLDVWPDLFLSWHASVSV